MAQAAAAAGGGAAFQHGLSEATGWSSDRITEAALAHLVNLDPTEGVAAAMAATPEKIQEDIEKRMTPAQLAEAQHRARDWKPE